MWYSSGATSFCGRLLGLAVLLGGCAGGVPGGDAAAASASDGAYLAPAASATDGGDRDPVQGRVREFLDTVPTEPDRAAEMCEPLIIAPALWAQLREADQGIADIGTHTITPFDAPGKPAYEMRTFVDEALPQLMRAPAFIDLAGRLSEGTLRADTPDERELILDISPSLLPGDTPGVVVDAGELRVAFLVLEDTIVWMENLAGWTGTEPARPVQAPSTEPPAATGPEEYRCFDLTEVRLLDTEDGIASNVTVDELAGFIQRALQALDAELLGRGSTATGDWNLHVVLGPYGLGSLSVPPKSGLPRDLGRVLYLRLRDAGVPRTDVGLIRFDLIVNLRPCESDVPRRTE